MATTPPRRNSFRISFANPRQACLLLAALLNSSDGGYLEVVHEEVFEQGSTSLQPTPPHLLDQGYKFERVVLARLDSASSPGLSSVWSTKKLFYALSDPILESSHQYHTITYKPINNGSVLFHVPPLPPGELAFIDTPQPSTRAGEQRHPMSLHWWWSRLPQTTQLAFREETHARPFLDTETVQTPLETHFGSPHTYQDFKWPMEIKTKSLSMIFDLHGWYLTEALLNTNGPNRRLLLGIEECTGLPIGLPIEWNKENLNLVRDRFRSSISSSIFPAINPSHFKLVLHRLIGTTMKDWDGEEMLILPASANRAALALLFSKGRHRRYRR